VLDADAFVLGLGEVLRKPERVRRRAVLLIVLQAFAALGNARDVAKWNPPEAVAGLLHLLEPFGAVAKHSRVIGLVGIGAQRFEGLPDRHIDDNEGIVVVSNVRGIADFGFKAPDETRSLVSECIDGIELGDELSDFRIIQRSNKTRNVDLSEMMGHLRGDSVNEICRQIS